MLVFFFSYFLQDLNLTFTRSNCLFKCNLIGLSVVSWVGMSGERILQLCKTKKWKLLEVSPISFH